MGPGGEQDTQGATSWPSAGAQTEGQALDRWTACGLLGGFSESLLVRLRGGEVLAGEWELGAARWPDGKAGAGRGATRRPWRPLRGWGPRLTECEPLGASGMESRDELTFSRDASERGGMGVGGWRPGPAPAQPEIDLVGGR